MSFDDLIYDKPDLEQEADEAIDEALEELIEDDFSDETKIKVVEDLVDKAKELADKDEEMSDTEKGLMKNLFDLYDGIIKDIKEERNK